MLDLQLQAVAYIDDCILAGSADSLSKSLPLLTEHLAAYGLHLAGHKCQVYGVERGELERYPNLQPLLPPEDAPMGIVICGHALRVSFDDDLSLPIGSTQFQMQWFHGKLATLHTFLQQVRDLATVAPEEAPGLQVTHHLLNELLPAKILHIVRSLAQPIWAEWIEDLQQEVQHVTAKWLGLPRLEAQQLQVAKLKAMQGGIGLVDLPVLALTARVAALYMSF